VKKKVIRKEMYERNNKNELHKEVKEVQRCAGE
jgi:hypothetical protein